MGSALLSGWISSKIPLSISVVEPQYIHQPSVTHFKSLAQAEADLAGAEAIILAIKPQNLPAACTEIRPHVQDDCLILSIAAGQSLNSIGTFFKTSQPIIRSMPNTPAAIGKGISVAVCNAQVKDNHKTLCTILLETSGPLEWLEDESLLDAVTALSGSGPAYIFHLIEILTKAGENIGLPATLAMQLARQTVIGAAALAEAEPQISPAQLRENVTSPGGTTQAALNVLMDGRLQKLYTEALSAARKRGQELNKL